MKTLDVLKVVTDHGWVVIREAGNHKMLEKNATRIPFNYHDNELGGTEIRKLARRFNIAPEAFFTPHLVAVKPLPKPKLSTVAKEAIAEAKAQAIQEGPISGAAKLLYIRVADLQVDHRYQQPLNARWARWLADNWDERLVGLFTVSKREDGGFYTLEGQHRTAALRSMGLEDRRVPCLVFEHLTLKDEADIYLGRNTIKAQHMVALFNAKLTAGDPAAVDIDRIVRDLYKLEVGTNSAKSVQSIGVLFKIHSWGELASTMAIWHNAWGSKKDNKDTLRGPILQAIGAVSRFYGKTLDAKRLSDMLKPYTGLELMYMASARNQGVKRQTFVALAEVMRNVYNHRLHSNALPPVDLTASVTRHWTALAKGGKS